MSGWRATVPSERLFGDPRFLMLEEPDQALLLRLYARCDKWGRGPAHRNVLAVHLCLVRADVREQLDHLAAFVVVYSIGGHEYYQILDYDADAMRETLRKRGPSNYPAPPETGSKAGLTPPKVDAQAGLEAPETGPKAGPDPQKTGGNSALVRARQRSERGEGEERERGKAGLATPAGPPAPAWTPSAWSTPEHHAAAERYLATLAARTGRPPAYKSSALAELAERYADTFVAAVAEVETRDVGWEGWHVKDPRKWLETVCKQVAEQRARPPRPAPAKSPPAAPKGGFYGPDYSGPKQIGVLR